MTFVACLFSMNHCLVTIDRKYNRTTDTGRFELIHKGTPVPVPIYVGMELRVEGKVCKTGRVQNTTTKIIAPVSAPPQITASKEAPIAAESDELHSRSALDQPLEELSTSTKNDTLTRPMIDANDTMSSESIADKTDDGPYHFYPAEKLNPFPNRRTKKSPMKNNRITVDTLPVRSINRTKVEQHVPSSKSKTSHLVLYVLPLPLFNRILRY